MYMEVRPKTGFRGIASLKSTVTWSRIFCTAVVGAFKAIGALAGSACTERARIGTQASPKLGQSELIVKQTAGKRARPTKTAIIPCSSEGGVL